MASEVALQQFVTHHLVPPQKIKWRETLDLVIFKFTITTTRWLHVQILISKKGFKVSRKANMASGYLNIVQILKEVNQRVVKKSFFL